jgi:hypothetical protein
VEEAEQGRTGPETNLPGTWPLAASDALTRRPPVKPPEFEDTKCWYTENQKDEENGTRFDRMRGRPRDKGQDADGK